MSMTRPTGAGYFNYNLNDLITDPNTPIVILDSNLLAMSQADRNATDVTTYQMMLIVTLTTTFNWYWMEFDVETEAWTNLDSDTGIGVDLLNTVLLKMPVNSYNLPIDDDTATDYFTMWGITP